jgi:hypothetical protein
MWKHHICIIIFHYSFCQESKLTCYVLMLPWTPHKISRKVTLHESLQHPFLQGKFLTLYQTPHKPKRFTSKVIATNIVFDKNQCPIVWLKTPWCTTCLKVFVIALAMAHVSPFNTIVMIGNYSKWWCLKHILKSFEIKLHWKQSKFSLYCP